MAPYETLYGRKYWTPPYWDEVGERKLKNVKLIEATLQKIEVIQDKLKVAQDRQKSYADTRMRVMVFLKVAY